MIQYKGIVVVKGDKDSSIVKLKKKKDYINKLDTMINDSIRKGTYVETVGNILKKLL